MDSRELSEWIAYDQLCPFGEERADLRMGILASTIANVNKSRKRKAYRPQDFMPKFRPESGPKSWQEIKAVCELLNAAFGGEVVARGDDRDSRD